MIFYNYWSIYSRLPKITNPLGINRALIRESAYIFVHRSIFNLILIDNNQLIAARLASMASKSGMSPAFTNTWAYCTMPLRSITNEALFETPFIL